MSLEQAVLGRGLGGSVGSCAPCPPRETYHPHLGEVDQAVLCVIGCPLLDEGQVSEVHPQVRDTGWVTTWKQMASTKNFHLRKRTSAKNRTPSMQILPV